MDQFKSKVGPADGKLAVLLPGMGAVATTFIAGVEAVKAGLGKPIGSLTQMAHVRLGKRSEKRWAMIKDLVPLARLEDLVFGGWGPIPDDAYTAAAKAQVIAAFEKALDADHPNIYPSQLYAYAAIMCGVPYLNGAPNMSCDFPALVELAEKRGVAIGGKDFKTGQTLMKTIIAPGLKARMLGMEG